MLSVRGPEYVNGVFQTRFLYFGFGGVGKGGVGEGLGKGWGRVGDGLGRGLGRGWGRVGAGLDFSTSKTRLKNPVNSGSEKGVFWKKGSFQNRFLSARLRQPSRRQPKSAAQPQKTLKWWR